MVRATRINAPTLARDEDGYVMPVAAPGTARGKAFTGTASESAALTSTVVRIVATSPCWYTIGPDVDDSAEGATADVNSHYLPANTPYDWRVDVGDMISVIDDGTGGTLYITELV